MDLAIRGRVALVGGASKGLGRACAFELARAGANLILCARGKEALNRTAEEISAESKVKVVPVVADITTSAGIREVLSQGQAALGPIDILIVNSGGPKPAAFSELSLDDWQEGFRNTLLYAVDLYNQVIPKMKERQWGRIINITSLAVKEPQPGLVLSGVFRSGLVSLTKALSRELAPFNITINSVCPGNYKTERAKELLAVSAAKLKVSVDELEKQRVQEWPLKRYQDPSELGAMIAFLASENARGITGSTIQVDGGISKGLL